MKMMSLLRSGGVAMSLAAAVIALPVLAQTQTQQPQPAAGPAPQQAQTGVYSGAADAAAQRTPDSDCKSPNEAMGAKSPEQLQQALAASKTPTYSGTAEEQAARQAAATCSE